MNVTVKLKIDPLQRQDPPGKKLKIVGEMESGEIGMQICREEDIFYEILKHLDAKALATAACVNRHWKRAALDETLWENVCTRNWPSISSTRAVQLRSVVLALGGFRRLYVLCLRPLLSRPVPESPNREWSKDEVHLSLSLFSIDCYERLGSRYTLQHSPLKLLCKTPLPPADQFRCLGPSSVPSVN